MPRPSAMTKWPQQKPPKLLLPLLLLQVLLLQVDLAVSLVAGQSRQFLLPEFESLPPRVTYTRPGVPVSLSCRAKASIVQCGFRSDAGDADIRFVPADSDLQRGIRCRRDGIIIEASAAAVGRPLSRLEFFCKAVSPSNFAVVSAPFRVEVAMLEPYPGPRQLVTKQCFKGNKVQIECQLPVSSPPAEIIFTANGAPFNPLAFSNHVERGRFRSVQLADGAFALVISKVLSDDGDKFYGCNATNPITRETIESPVRTLLKVQQPFLDPSGAPLEDAVSPFPPKIVSPPRPTELTVTEGDNVTYTCITESSPIAEISYLREEGRLGLPTTANETRDFAMLQFVVIRQEDQGEYMCRVSYRKDLTASSHLRDEKKLAPFRITVKKRLSIMMKPDDVILDDVDSAANFDCRLQGNAGRPPLWFFNGRLVDAKDPASGFVIHETQSDQGSYRLTVPRVDASFRGVVQCVANDRERRVWESAQAVLLMRGDSVRSQPAPEPPTQPPVQPTTSTLRPSVTEPNTSVSYRVLKYKESFVQVTCGSRYSSRRLYDWRFFKDGQPVDLNSDEIPQPYMQYSDVLSLVLASQRSRARFYQGVYACRIYERATGRLVWTEVTHLSFEPSPEDAEIPVSTSGPAIYQQRPTTQAAPTAAGEDVSERLDIGEPITVSAPEVILAEGPLALNISWTVSPPGAAFRIRRFRVQQLELTAQSESSPSSPERQRRLVAAAHSPAAAAGLPTTLEEVSASVQSVLWSGVRPQRIYQFRVAFEIIGSSGGGGDGGGDSDGVSPWSRPISFAHVAGSAPRITALPRHPREPLTWSFTANTAEAASFVIWVRNLSVPQPQRRYIKYWVSNGSARQFFFYDLAAGPSYELCMFARLAGNRRSPDSRVRPFSLATDTGGSRRSDRRGPNQLDGDDKDADQLPSTALLLLLLLAGAIGLLLMTAGFVFLGLCLRRRHRDRKLRARLTNDSWSNNITYAPHMPMPTAYAVDPMKEPPKMQLQAHNQQQIYLAYQHATLGGRGGQPPLQQQQTNLFSDFLDGGICPRPPQLPPVSSGQHSVYASLRSQRERTPMLLEFCPAPNSIAAQCSPAAAMHSNAAGCHGNEECELTDTTAAAATPRLQRSGGGQLDTESPYSCFSSQEQQELSQPAQDSQQQHYQTPTVGRSAATLDSSRRHHKRRRRQQAGQGTPTTFAREQLPQSQTSIQPMSPIMTDQRHSPTPPPVPKHRRINGRIYARPSDLQVFGSVGPTAASSIAQSQRHRLTMGGGYSSPQPPNAVVAKLQQQQRAQTGGSASQAAYATSMVYNA